MTTETESSQTKQALNQAMDTKHSRQFHHHKPEKVSDTSSIQTINKHFKSNGSGAMNDHAQVIIASGKHSLSRSALSVGNTMNDTLACTCHLYQPKPQQSQAHLHWSSSESTLGGAIAGAVDSARQQRLLYHPHYQSMARHHTIQRGVNKMMVMSEDEWQRRQQQYQQYLERVSSVSDTQLNCDGQCCCEWFGRALLCSCQLPSSSDEAPSPSPKAAVASQGNQSNGVPINGVGNGNGHAH